ncbi:hypothetical protein ACTHO5_08150 [Cytobacillus praedii]
MKNKKRICALVIAIQTPRQFSSSKSILNFKKAKAPQPLFLVAGAFASILLVY